MAEKIAENEKIHSYVTWPESWEIFDDGRGGLAFPEQNNSNCPDIDPAEPLVTINSEVAVLYDDATGITEADFTPSYSMSIEADTLYLRPSEFHMDNENSVSFVDPIGDNVVAYMSTAVLVPNTLDPLVTTELPDATISGIAKDGDKFTFSVSNPPTNQFTWIDSDPSLKDATDITFDVKVSLSISGDNAIYVNLQHQDNPSENGVYRYSAGNVYKVSTALMKSDEGHDDVVDDKTANDNVPCCGGHFRKTYSHAEVADYAKSKIGDIAAFGVKSFAVSDCDGGFIDWFTTDGEVNIGNGTESVFVNGFGLGSVYKNSSDSDADTQRLPRDDYDENDGTLHPWLTWAYGTRSDARTPTNLVALPRDWPFRLIDDSPVTIYNDVNDANNITLVKRGVVGNDTVGNLEFDREEEGQPTKHVYYNRHHVVLYPEFSSQSDGTVVVKPTYIHIPAGMDTKDGEIVELTVSIQNVDQETFGKEVLTGDDDIKKIISGYHAAMSQPRVYVMGGVQKFSNKKMTLDRNEIHQESSEFGEQVYTYTAYTPVVAKSADGKTLEADTDVRATIVVSKTNATGTRRKFTAVGKIIYIDEDGTYFRFNGKFPYDINGRGWNDMVFTICGMAYLDGEDNPTETKMGLVGRDDDVMVGDIGSGTADALDEINKFYSIGETEGRVELPHTDKRFLLATVYQTATNTFPWELTGRRRMAKIDRHWTDESHRRPNGNDKSIVNKIYEQNKQFFSTFQSVVTDDMLSSNWPVSYNTSATWESLASVLRVTMPDTLIKASHIVTTFDGNPVRQASRAIKEFAADFRRMRLLSYWGSKKARVKITGISIDSSSITDWPSAGDTIIDSDAIHPVAEWNGVDHADNDVQFAFQKDMINSAWCANMRSLPDYVIKADYGQPDDMSPINAIFANSTNPDWATYADALPYNASSPSPYAASACVDEEFDKEPATVVGTPNDYETYSENSVCARIIQQLSTKRSVGGIFKDIGVAQISNEMRRYADTVLAVKEEQNTMGLLGIGLNFRTDWANPFTHICSLDGAPVPEFGVRDYPETLPDAQREFVESDAVQCLRYAYGDDDKCMYFVSSIMPDESETSNALSRFVQKYVAAYGAGMTKRFYQGTRFMLKDGKFNSDPDDAIYVHTIDRIKRRLKGETDILDRYLMDNFARTSADSRNSNFDRAFVDYASLSVSEPPYAMFRNEKTKEPGDSNSHNTTYTRVFMQFTFSQKAGRWYTTDYRQYPTNYLTPLYGADALNAGCYSIYDTDGSINGHSSMRALWQNSACEGFNSYRSHVYSPYSVVPPMDVNLGCVPFLYGATPITYADISRWPTVNPDFPYNLDAKLKPAWSNWHDLDTCPALKRLEKPYLDLEDGGVGLYPPADVNGGHKAETDLGVHANFWSVRKFIRPAVSVLPGTDIPYMTEKTVDGNTGVATEYSGGVISDPTLYTMFDFPIRGEKLYVMPSETDPEDDTAMQVLLYHDADIDVTDKMENKKATRTNYMGYGLSADAQDLDE